MRLYFDQKPSRKLRTGHGVHIVKTFVRWVVF